MVARRAAFGLTRRLAREGACWSAARAAMAALARLDVCEAGGRHRRRGQCDLPDSGRGLPVEDLQRRAGLTRTGSSGPAGEGVTFARGAGGEGRNPSPQARGTSHPNEPLRDADRILREYAFSQMPVRTKGGAPAGEPPRWWARSSSATCSNGAVAGTGAAQGPDREPTCRRRCPRTAAASRVGEAGGVLQRSGGAAVVLVDGTPGE